MTDNLLAAKQLIGAGGAPGSALVFLATSTVGHVAVPAQHVEALRQHRLVACDIHRPGRGTASVAGLLPPAAARRTLTMAPLARAAEYFVPALAIYRHVDHPAGTATQLLKLGEVSLRRGKCEQARHHW